MKHLPTPQAPARPSARAGAHPHVPDLRATARRAGQASTDAERLRRAIDQRSGSLGLTREALASKAGVSRTTLYEWLAGTSAPSAAGWGALARGLDVSVGVLLAEACALDVHPVLVARLERGWSREELARHTGVAASSVRQVEAGGQVRADVAHRLAEALGLGEDLRNQMARGHAGRSTSPLGELLEQARLERGWSVAELARHFGVSRQMVSLWLNGSDRVAVRWLPTVAMLTGRSVSDLEGLR